MYAEPWQYVSGMSKRVCLDSVVFVVPLAAELRETQYEINSAEPLKGCESNVSVTDE
jgi:hypothetical protein